LNAKTDEAPEIDLCAVGLILRQEKSENVAKTNNFKTKICH